MVRNAGKGPPSPSERITNAALKITGDLERIGDYAANVAKRTIVLAQFSLPYSLSGLGHTARDDANVTSGELILLAMRLLRSVIPPPGVHTNALPNPPPPASTDEVPTPCPWLLMLLARLETSPKVPRSSIPAPSVQRKAWETPLSRSAISLANLS